MLITNVLNGLTKDNKVLFEIQDKQSETGSVVEIKLSKNVNKAVRGIQSIYLFLFIYSIYIPPSRAHCAPQGG